MTPSFALLTMAGFLATANIPVNPYWESDYSEARKHAEAARKPLAVVVGAGENGWQTLTNEGSMPADVRKTLCQNYICIYINNETDQGRKSALALGIQHSGIVISDRSTELKAFQHSGKLSQVELNRRLTRYADPQHVVTATETVAPAPPVVPVNYYGGCPNCRRQ